MNNTFFLDNIKRFFTLNKKLVIWSIIIILLGFVTGVFCALKSNVNLDFCYLQDFLLKNLLCNKYSFIGFAILKTLLFCLFLIAIFFISFFKIGTLLLLGAIVYLSFLLGVDVVVIVCCCGLLKGLILSIFCLFICQVLLFFILLLFGHKMICLNKQLKIYGNNLIHGCEFQIFLFFLLLGFAIIVVQTFLIFLICKFFVF